MMVWMSMAFAGTWDWQVVNDTVMGGVSEGRLIKTSESAHFRGTLSLEQNGGFVSIRTTPKELDWGDVSALRVTVQGDGRTWSVNTYRSDVRMRAGSYRTEIRTTQGKPTTHTVVLADFRATSFGRPVPNAPSLDSRPDAIEAIGFLLADKQPGPFELRVLSVEPIRERRGPTPDAGVRPALEQAIARGVPEFNAGDIQGCVRAYTDALTEQVASNALTDGEQSVVAEALETSASQGPRDAAWTLRYAIDSLLAARP